MSKQCGGCQPTQPVQNWMDMVQEFRAAAGLLATDCRDRETMSKKMDLLIEEFEETFNAAGFTFTQEGDPTLPEGAECNAPELFDGMIDMIYVLIDWALSYGWDINAGFKKVHAANMTKVTPGKGIILNADGKILKPENFEPAELNNLVGDEE